MEQVNHLASNNEREWKRKWKDIEIHGSEYVVSTSTLSNGWEISLSNLVEIWSETITRDIASARCQSLNLLLDLDSFDITETLDIILNDIPKYTADVSVDEIKLKTSIDGVVFKFSINLTKGSPQHLWNIVTKPLCQASTELQYRYNILLDLVKKKDEELAEYKFSGAELTRKNFETRPYTDEIFNNTTSAHYPHLDNSMQTFRLMIERFSNTKKSEPVLRNPAKHVKRRSSDVRSAELNIKSEIDCMDAPVNTSIGNADNAEELQSVTKTKCKKENSPTCESSISKSGTEIIEINQDNQTKVKIDDPQISSQPVTVKCSKNRSTENDVQSVSLPSIGQAPKRSPPRKRSRNIYDFIS